MMYIENRTIISGTFQIFFEVTIIFFLSVFKIHILLGLFHYTARNKKKNGYLATKKAAHYHKSKGKPK